MGLSSSKTKPKPLVNKTQNDYDARTKGKAKKMALANVAENTDKRSSTNNSGKRVCERKDSKQFWISHLRFRRNSREVYREVCSHSIESKQSTSSSNQNKQPEQTVKNPGIRRKSKYLEPDFGMFVAENEDNGVNEVKAGSVCSKTSRAVENPGELGPHSTVTTETKHKFQEVSIQELFNYLNDGALSPCICDTSYLLLIDTRDKDLYEKSHIITARLSKTLYTDLQSYSLYGYNSVTNLENALNEFTFVIVYGGPITGSNIDGMPEMKLLRELDSYGVEPYLLNAGFDAFYEAFPFMCTNMQFVRPDDYKKIQTYPSIILQNQLYQGRGDQATNKKVVQDLKLTHIVNITQEHKSAFLESIEYLTLKLDDVPQTQLIKFFERTTYFLTEAINNGGRVLVHCNMGVSRSSSITIAYLIKAKGWTLRAAHNFVKERRSCIRPNRGFLQQLSAWEEMVLGKKFTDADNLWF